MKNENICKCGHKKMFHDKDTGECRCDDKDNVIYNCPCKKFTPKVENQSQVKKDGSLSANKPSGKISLTEEDYFADARPNQRNDQPDTSKSDEEILKEAESKVFSDNGIAEDNTEYQHYIHENNWLFDAICKKAIALTRRDCVKKHVHSNFGILIFYGAP